ncbi:hypothetical protein QL285_035543 [Trifolium repens]|nr:hypothetical protein QL285_035543 [Trifolium repens]
MSQDPSTPNSLTLNLIPLNNVFTDINFIKSTVRLKVYIIYIIYVKFQKNPKSFDMLLRYIKVNGLRHFLNTIDLYMSQQHIK